MKKKLICIQVIWTNVQFKKERNTIYDKQDKNHSGTEPGGRFFIWESNERHGDLPQSAGKNTKRPH